MNLSAHTSYAVIVLGIVLFSIGLLIDLIEHGMEFVITEFRHAPLAHGLPLAGIMFVIVGLLFLRRRLE